MCSSHVAFATHGSPYRVLIPDNLIQVVWPLVAKGLGASQDNFLSSPPRRNRWNTHRVSFTSSSCIISSYHAGRSSASSPSYYHRPPTNLMTSLSPHIRLLTLLLTHTGMVIIVLALIMSAWRGSLARSLLFRSSLWGRHRRY